MIQEKYLKVKLVMVRYRLDIVQQLPVRTRKYCLLLIWQILRVKSLLMGNA